jgi:hypothetical protein
VFTSQEGSLGEVSEFFKVMAQVDRDLTTVDYFDRLLGLIKNLGRHKLFFQGLRPEHCVAVSLEHVRFLSGSLHDILQQTTTVTWVLSIYGRLTTQGYRQLTFIHCSAWCIASK